MSIGISICISLSIVNFKNLKSKNIKYPVIYNDNLIKVIQYNANIENKFNKKVINVKDNNKP